MTEILSVSTAFYQMPTDAVLQSRKMFYLSEKENTEAIWDWFYRVSEAVKNCDFGHSTEFQLIDKFFCGLENEAILRFRKTHTWSTEQLIKAVVNWKLSIEDQATNVQQNITVKEEDDDVVNDTFFFDANTESDDSDDQKLSELKQQIEKQTVKNENNDAETQNGKLRSQRPTSKHMKQENEAKNFTIDATNLFNCLQCSKSFRQRTSLTQHQRLHTGKNLIYCSICNKVFVKPSKLKLHFMKHEREQSVAGKSFECHLCKFQFLRVQGLRIHINVKHVMDAKNDFQCKHCYEVFAHQTHLDNHLRAKHQLHIDHKCPHCSKEFEHLWKLKEHLMIHSDAKPFMCEICGNAFKTKKQLHLHMARHTNERRFKCGECGQMLKSRSNYKNHMRQHTGERPFKCTQCEKTFVQRANYLKHLRWHSGDKPHACMHCGKRFPTAYDMKLHVNSIHTGDRPFACTLCDSKFSQPSTLRVHRLRVHR